jgi:hypothetical protein
MSDPDSQADRLSAANIAAIKADPSPANVTALVMTNPSLATAIVSAAIATAPALAADITNAAIAAAPDSATAITQVAIVAVGTDPAKASAFISAVIKANPALATAILTGALAGTKNNPALTGTITNAASVAAPNLDVAAIAGNTNSGSIATSNSSESTINNQQLQSENLTAAIVACNGNTTCENQVKAEAAASSSLTPAEINAAVSPN